jgi:hypothetical protein
MRKLSLAVLIASALALPLHAADGQQSYFTYDDGGTVVHQGTDGNDADGRVNYPLFAGDEITTNRRGRSEIRLSDGNIIAVDRSTSIKLSSINDTYESDDAQTVAELRYGHVVVQRTDATDQPLRLDTANASYIAGDEAIYAVDTDSHGKDRVTVFDGQIEVRTPSRDTLVSAGHEAHIDDEGVYGMVSESRPAADDFERWFMRRAERYRDASSRYLDTSIAYSDSDLAANGSWIFAGSLGTWCWHPNVTAAWRPYTNGYWQQSPTGTLVWVSDETWGWVPYHYGRWANDPVYGWVWLPGTGYAPAWVYWMYGADYVGWAPAGWYDCYRPYYGWAYRPYARAGISIGFGFYGRVHVSDIDLRPWTFVSPGTLVSRRSDRASLTVDAVRERLARGGASNNGFATISGTPARFNRSELRDPAQAVASIARRGAGGAGGDRAAASPIDMTPFFRRDAQLPRDVQERIVRNRPTDPGRGAAVTAGGNGGNSSGRIPRDGIRRGDAPGGSSAVVPGVTPAPVREGLRRGNPGSSTFPDDGIGRGSLHRDQPGATETSRGGNATAPEREVIAAPAWRNRPSRIQPQTPEGSSAAPATTAERPAANDGWRRRTPGAGDTPRAQEGTRTAPTGGSRDVPRRVIEGIGGARIHRDNGGGSSSGSSAQPRQAPPPQVHEAPPPQPRPAPAPASSSDDGRVKRERP